MVQVTRFWQENVSRWRASLIAIVVGLAFFNAGCASLVKVRDNSIPKLLTPVTDAKFNDLLSQLQPFTDLQALRASQVYIQFIDAESSEKFRYEADSILLLNRPDKIRLLIQAPGIKTKISDMVSESNQFKVGIYYPSEYRRFLLGTNDADYSMWRARLAEKERRSGLTSARPFHFTEALMMRPLRCGFMIRSASRVHKNGPRKFTASTFSQAASDSSSNGPPSNTPALLTRISSR